MSIWSVEDEYALRERQEQERENRVKSKFKEGEKGVNMTSHFAGEEDMRGIQENELKFKVGDKVKTLSAPDYIDESLAPIGSIGVVTIVDTEDDLSYAIESKNFNYTCGWYWFSENELELVGEDTDKVVESVQDNLVKPIKSDGGSSSYYFTKLPEDLIKQIVETGGIEIKDIVRYCFDNDADCKDIIKALKRIREYLKGGGKEGVDAMYDANKIEFFAKELKEWLKIISKGNKE